MDVKADLVADKNAKHSLIQATFRHFIVRLIFRGAFTLCEPIHLQCFREALAMFGRLTDTDGFVESLQHALNLDEPFLHLFVNLILDGLSMVLLCEWRLILLDQLILFFLQAQVEKIQDDFLEDEITLQGVQGSQLVHELL